MLERLVSRWQGVILSLIGIVSISWLAVTGQLGLYIHPRYFVFTVIMAVLGGIVTLAAFAITPLGDDHEHHDGDHDGHSDDDGRLADTSSRGRRWSPLATGAAIVALAAAFCAFAIIPPATLTSATVDKRDLNSSVGQGSGGGDEARALAGSDVEALTLRDWATLLRDGSSGDFVIGKTTTLSGFVTADPNDSENVFYLTRFVVTCCAVDAQPIGVPVYSPGWADHYPVESWVEAKGTFSLNPSALSLEGAVIANPTVTPIDQPAEPYAY